MLSKSAIVFLLSCTSVLAAPLEIKPRDVDYGYGSYGTYPPPPGVFQPLLHSLTLLTGHQRAMENMLITAHTHLATNVTQAYKHEM